MLALPRIVPWPSKTNTFIIGENRNCNKWRQHDTTLYRNIQPFKWNVRYTFNTTVLKYVHHVICNCLDIKQNNTVTWDRIHAG